MATSHWSFEATNQCFENAFGPGQNFLKFKDKLKASIIENFSRIEPNIKYHDIGAIGLTSDEVADIAWRCLVGDDLDKFNEVTRLIYSPCHFLYMNLIGWLLETGQTRKLHIACTNIYYCDRDNPPWEVILKRAFELADKIPETAAYCLFAYFNYYEYNGKSDVAVQIPTNQLLKDILARIQEYYGTSTRVPVDEFDKTPFLEGQGFLISLALEIESDNIEVTDELYEEYLSTISKCILTAFPGLHFLEKAEKEK